MPERFKVNKAMLREAAESDFGCLNELSDADDLFRLVSGLAGAEIIEAPEGLEILIYPSSVDEPHVALITVWATSSARAHVVAGSEELRKLATSDLWHGDDEVARTLEIVQSTLALADGAVESVRGLERWVEEVARSAV